MLQYSGHLQTYAAMYYKQRNHTQVFELQNKQQLQIWRCVLINDGEFGKATEKIAHQYPCDATEVRPRVI
jgi:hypothetical protein